MIPLAWNVCVLLLGLALRYQTLAEQVTYGEAMLYRRLWVVMHGLDNEGRGSNIRIPSGRLVGSSLHRSASCLSY